MNQKSLLFLKFLENIFIPFSPKISFYLCFLNIFQSIETMCVFLHFLLYLDFIEILCELKKVFLTFNLIHSFLTLIYRLGSDTCFACFLCLICVWLLIELYIFSTELFIWLICLTENIVLLQKKNLLYFRFGYNLF